METDSFSERVCQDSWVKRRPPLGVNAPLTSAQALAPICQWLRSFCFRFIFHLLHARRIPITALPPKEDWKTIYEMPSVHPRYISVPYCAAVLGGFYHVPRPPRKPLRPIKSFLISRDPTTWFSLSLLLFIPFYLCHSFHFIWNKVQQMKNTRLSGIQTLHRYQKYQLYLL